MSIAIRPSRVLKSSHVPTLPAAETVNQETGRAPPASLKSEDGREALSVNRAPAPTQDLSHVARISSPRSATSSRRLGVPGDVGGKTGTTTDAVDAWFVGFNSAVVAGVWVGFDEPRSIGDNGSGAQAALPIWAEFMRLTAHRLPSTPMTPPAGLRAVTLCRLSHQRAGDDCPGYTEYFKDGDEVPAELCALHQQPDAPPAERAVETLFGAISRRLQRIFR